MWLIFLSRVTHFSSVTQFDKCDPYSKVRPPKCDALLYVWPIFPSLIMFFKCDLFFKMWHIFQSVTHFSKCDTFFQVWHIFQSVTHFSKCDTFIKVLPKTHFQNEKWSHLTCPYNLNLIAIHRGNLGTVQKAMCFTICLLQFTALRVSAYKNRPKPPINGTSQKIDFGLYFAHRQVLVRIETNHS